MVIGVLIALLITVRISLKSDWVHELIRARLVVVGEEMLNGQLQVENISGDLYHTVVFQGITVYDSLGQRAIYIDTLKARYTLWSYFGSSFIINEISLSGAEISVEEWDSGSWNIFTLVATDTTESQMLSLEIGSLVVTDSRIDVRSAKLPSSRVQLSDIELATRVQIVEDGVSVGLRRLAMQISEGNLEESSVLTVVGDYSEGSITLEKLTLFTGRTLLDLVARYREDSGELSADVMLTPLSWRDVAAYTPEPYFVEDLELRLGFRGSMRDLQVHIGVSARGIEGLDVHTSVSVDRGFELRDFSLQSGRLDLPLVTGNDSLPVLGSVAWSGDGRMELSSFGEGAFTSELVVREVSWMEYGLDVLTVELINRGSRLQAEVTGELGNERIGAYLMVMDYLGVDPAWEMEAVTGGMNLGVWLSDGSLDGMVRGEIKASGWGLEPGERAWEVDLRVGQSRIGLTEVAESDTKVRVTAGQMEVVSDTRLVRSKLSIESHIVNWSTDELNFTYQIRARDVNVAEFIALPNFSTSLQFDISGKGRGVDLQSMEVGAVLMMSQSEINGARLDSLVAEMLYVDGILVITESLLESSLATAKFALRQDVFDITDPANRFDFELKLGDVGPLAPLIGAEMFRASGSIEGTLRTPQGVAQIEIQALLDEIMVDTVLVRSIELTGTAEGQHELNYELDTRVIGIQVGTYTLEDTWFRSYGTLDSLGVNGQYRLNLSTRNELSVMTLADFTIRGDDIRVETTDFQLNVPDKQLHLYRPFVFSYDGTHVKTESIYLRGTSGVELTLGVVQTSEQGYRGFINARNLDLSIIEHMNRKPVMVAGKASGEIEFDIDFIEESYDGFVELFVTDFELEGMALELAELDIRVSMGRANARFRASQTGRDIVRMEFDIPFSPGDPTEFDDGFFAQPVSGTFELAEMDLSTQDLFLEWLGVSGTTGTISANGKLSGSAGSPEFTGEFQYGDGRFSGVPIDHFDFGWQYHEKDEKLALTSRMVSSGQEVVFMYGSIPFNVDWRTFHMMDVGEDSQMDLTVKTSSFDLAAMSPFLDQMVAQNLQGILTMDMKVTGDPLNPTLRGDLNLQRGQVYLVDNNITIRGIESMVQFHRDRMVLKNLSMQSNGRFQANGEIQIEGFSPGEVVITMSADNFRAYDTRDIQAFVTMNATLGGRLEAPTLRGNLHIDRGYLFLDNFGERTVEEVRLDEEAVSIFEELAIWDNMAMEFKFSTQRNFWVRNRNRPDIQLQLNGELDLVKSRGQDVEVFGRMGVNDGYVIQLGKRFTFDQGDVIFSGSASDPQLEIKTLYALRQPSDIKIWYVIGGTAQDPEFTYESDPEMELQDIVSYTVFGRPFHSLMAWEQTITGRSESAVADAAVDILLDRVEQLATEQLGIDLLQIDNTRASGNTGTTIKAGKFVSNRLFVALLQELGSNPLSQIIIEYELKRDLDLIVTGSDSYHNGIDIRWKYDY